MFQYTYTLAVVYALCEEHSRGALTTVAGHDNVVPVQMQGPTKPVLSRSWMSLKAVTVLSASSSGMIVCWATLKTLDRSGVVRNNSIHKLKRRLPIDTHDANRRELIWQ
jgi:hypothetical protein